MGVFGINTPIVKGRLSLKPEKNFGTEKFERNKLRDQVVAKELKRLGWLPIVIWECETKRKDILAEIICNRINNQNGT